MIKNYIKVAWRNLWKNKVLTLINAFGLAVGLGFFFLTAGYVWNEGNVNSIIKDNERVYVLRSDWKRVGMGLEFTTLAPLAQALYDNYPQLIENFYHHDGINSIVSKGEKHFSETLQPGDSTFLRFFGFELLDGNPETALNKPNTLVLTASKAKKYFGRTDVVGQTLSIQSFSGEEMDFEITGVLKDLPFNTVTHYNAAENELFLSPSSLRFFGRMEAFGSWQNPYVISYVKLREGVDPQSLQEPIRDLLETHTTNAIHSNLEIYTTAIKNDYLQSDNGSAKRMIFTIAGIALFILIMAIINFVNTSAGNSLTRLKETGIRKVLGGGRRQTYLQYLTESVLFVSISTMFGLVIYYFARPPFSELLARDIPALNAVPFYYLLFPVLTAVVIGLIAGVYPAILLSQQPSVESLKGKLKSIREKVVLRRSLLALQFITAIVVFVGALVVHKQVAFFFNSDLGYEKASILVVKTPRDWTEAGIRKMQMARNEFGRLPQITEATFSYEVPDGQSGSVSNNLYKASLDSTSAITATSMVTDEHYAIAYGMEMAAGKFFDINGSPANSTSMILNETAVQELGWAGPEEAVGAQLRLQGSEEVYTVRGVVNDFHFNTMHERIRPIFFLHVTNAKLFRYFSFKIQPGNLAATIAALQKQWSALFPNAPFDYGFMDETLARRYQNELQLKKAARMATIIALLIVLLGVVGIVMLAINRKTREVGIRTVLGASLPQIVWLFAKEFSRIILLANLIAWPIAWLLLHRWLDHYAYRITLGGLPFVATGLVISLLTTLIIVILVMEKAMVNPVESLRSE